MQLLCHPQLKISVSFMFTILCYLMPLLYFFTSKCTTRLLFYSHLKYLIEIVIQSTAMTAITTTDTPITKFTYLPAICLFVGEHKKTATQKVTVFPAKCSFCISKPRLYSLIFIGNQHRPARCISCRLRRQIRLYPYSICFSQLKLSNKVFEHLRLPGEFLAGSGTFFSGS